MRKPYKDLSLNQLRTFRTVCIVGGYAAAARELLVSTSTIWEQMRGLEQYFESTLLESNAGRLQTTAEGRQLLELIMPLLAGLESAKEVLHQHRGRPPESILLVAGMRMLLEEVAAALPVFREHYPDVRVKCMYAEDSAIESMVERGEADFGLMLKPGPSRRRRSMLVHEAAYSLSFELVAPQEHALLKKRTLSLKDLFRFPLIIGAKGTSSRSRIDEMLHKEGRSEQLKIAVETNSAAMTFAYVRAGVGIGIAPSYPQGLLGVCLGTRSLTHWLGEAHHDFVWLKGAYIPPATRMLADAIRDTVVN